MTNSINVQPNVAAQIIDAVDSKKLSAYDEFSLALKSKEVKRQYANLLARYLVRYN